MAMESKLVSMDTSITDFVKNVKLWFSKRLLFVLLHRP